MSQATAYSLTRGDVDRRSATRGVVIRQSTLRDEAGEAIDVVVSDLSCNGFSMKAPGELRVGSLISIGLAGSGKAAAYIIRSSGHSYGCGFLVPLSAKALLTAFNDDRSVYRLKRTSTPEHSPLSERVDRWPRPIRVALIVGTATVLWILVMGISLALD